MKASALLVLVSGVMACSSTVNGTGSSSSGGGGEASSPQQACLDAADAFAQLADRCGEDYQTTYDGFIQSAANGDCANVTALRDEESFRSTCLPSFASIECSTFSEDSIDPSCRSQLIAASSFTARIGPASVLRGSAH